MNSKERVKTVLNGAIPGKVPWGEFAIDFDTVEKIIGHKTYFRAKAKSQMAFWEGHRDEVVQSWKEDMKRAVTYAMEQYKPGGNYIFGTSHSIAVGTQYDNFMTMVDEFERLRDL